MQRWPNEQSNVAPTIVAAVGPTLRQRLPYGWLTVTVLAARARTVANVLNFSQKWQGKLKRMIAELVKVKGKYAFLYSAVSSPWDCSKRFKLHPLADMLIPTPFGFLWEAFSHAAITARRLFVQISISVCSQVQLSELWQLGMNEIAEASKRQEGDPNQGSLD